MRLKLFILCFLTQIGILNAQNSNSNPGFSGTLSGKVIEKKNNQAIPYASITIKDEGKVITGGVTKDNGNYQITNLPLKTLTVEVTFMGFKKVTETFTLSNEDKSATRNFALEEEATQLGEVNVVKERSSIEQKIDRKVVNVGKDLIASGTTASDIMNNIPTLSVDPQTKELSLRGNTNVRVLIDGKPSNIEVSQLLQQIPSASIKQVELITNPSAKYNPEGMSGIINIILHKNANMGFNGSINTGVTFAKTPKTNSSLNLNYKVGKVNFYTNYGFNHGINANHGYVDSENPAHENHQDFRFRNRNNSHLIKLGFDYYINDKNTLSAFTSQNLTHLDGDGTTDVNFFNNTSNRDSFQFNTNENENKNQTYDLVFKHEFEKKGENLEMQVNYSKTKNNEFSDYGFNEQNSTDSLNKTFFNKIANNTDYTQINIDYTNPINEKTKIELGAETRIQLTNNTFLADTDGRQTGATSFLFTNNLDSHFDFNRTISSVYFNYGRQFGTKWSTQVGLRAEYYDLKAEFTKNEANYQSNLVPTNTSTTAVDKVEDDIFTVYPSLFINYKPSDKNSFNLNYSRRVDRPSIGQINPIREWTTPLMESRGNPALVPQFTNSLEFNYTRTMTMGTVTAGVFYRRINDEISRTVYTDPDNSIRRILSFGNFADNNAYGIEVSSNLKFTKWWAANTSVDSYFKTVRGTVENNITHLPENKEIDVTTFNARMNNTFTATKNLRFQLFGMYRGRDMSLQGERNPMYKADFGSTYNILKGKGTITLRFNDIFNTMNFGFDGRIPYRQSGEFFWESQSFYAGINYIFGGGKNRALQRKQRDQNETQSGGGMF